MDSEGVRKPSEGKQDEIADEPNNNAGKTEQSMGEEIPKIFHSGVKDIFPLFANMLDIKSFTLLSIANKEMYKMCKEDKRITINVEEEEMAVSGGSGSLEFSLIRSRIRLSRMHNYIVALRRLQCNVTLNVLTFCHEAGTQCIAVTHNYLKDIGVKRINRIVIFGGFSEWPKIFDFIKDFQVENVALPGNIPLNHLKTLLKMKELTFLSYNGDIAASVLLDVDSPIREIHFYGRKSISNDVFMQILWKVQTGPLEKLTIKTRSVNWSSFKPLDFYHAGPISDERPLAFSIRHPTNLNFWFLHWHGEVTKCCGRKGAHGDELVTIRKCKESEYPPAVRKKEDVFEDFAQKRPKINCTLAHFRSFFENYTVLDPSNKGPLPEERPLLCKDSFYGYKENNGHWLLNEDGTIERVCWTKDDAVIYEKYDMKSKWPVSCGHRALVRYLFTRMLKEMTYRTLHCESLEQFNSWFEGLTTIPFDTRGPLAEERPLVFEKKEMSSRGRVDRRVLLFADESIVECSFYHKETCANLHPCPSWDLPPILISSEKLKDIIQNAPMRKVIGMPMAVELFRSGFHGFKTLPFDYDGPLPSERPLVLDKTEFDEGYVTERRWLLRETETVVCTWKYDRADFKTGNPEEYPLALTKGLINECIMKDSEKFPSEGVSISLDAFHNCFRGFKVVPFGFRGTLPMERPLIFEAPITDSSVLRVLCKGERFLSFSWRENKVVCNGITQPKEIPAVLKTMDYLKNLMQMKWEKRAKHHVFWYGDRVNYTNFFNDKSFTKLRNSHSGPLPEKRPIVFVGPNRRYFLREDGTAVQCHWLKEDIAEIHVPPTFFDIPTNLMDLAFPK